MMEKTRQAFALVIAGYYVQGFVRTQVAVFMSVVSYVVQTTFDNGVLRLTTHRLMWDDEEQEVIVQREPLLLNKEFSSYWCTSL